MCSPWGRKELDMTERLNNNTVWGTPGLKLSSPFLKKAFRKKVTF